MKGFKDSTRMKYMCGGPVKKAMGGSVNDDPVARKVTPTAQGGPNKGQHGAPTKGQPAQPPATAKPKSGAFAGLMQLRDKMKGASKQPNTSTSGSPLASGLTPATKRAMREHIRDIEGKDSDKKVASSTKPAVIYPHAPGKGDTTKPLTSLPPGKGDTTKPLTSLPPGKGPGQPPQPPTKGKPDMYAPQISRGPVPYGKGGSAKKGVPAHNSRPMIGRRAGGLAVMPKGKC